MLSLNPESNILRVNQRLSFTKMHFRFYSILYSMVAMLLLEIIPFASLQQEHPHNDHNCYPPGSQVEEQFMIGYGSLMFKASKDGTHPNTGESVPIRLKGYERSWISKGYPVSFSTTYLGVHASSNESSRINAVYFKIPNAAILNFYDSREVFYCREEVDTSKLNLITKDSIKKGLREGQYWIYFTRPDDRETPTEEYPIVQSYVDKFISGCLELETIHKLDGFAEECVHTTGSWESPWVNDRIYPRRPYLYQKMASQIDGLLNKTVHKAYKKIKLEGSKETKKKGIAVE